MIKCLIVDDEPHAIEVLKKFCQRTPYLEIAGTFNNAIEPIALIESEKIDLIFLDINMPNFTGLDFVKSFGNKVNIVLTSAYSNYAINAFDNDVIDYLLKPFSFERFLIATQKVINRLSKPVAGVEHAKPEKREHIFVKTDKSKIVKINYDEIVYIEGLKNYISLYLTGNRRVITLLNMKTLEEKLQLHGVLRVHKSYLIALDKIISLDGGVVNLSGAEKPIPIGSTFRTSFLDSLKGRMLT
ncbi:LytTR family DNA-binding domain-containing protein [Pedobacter jeongneungensis]|uniref:LytTR family DNA-binding domain-containing protein n=1 Tax=Pedobacter jeongneungensis TaxID=947309 RepID=A0ABP8BDL1_9SPHI